MRWAVSSRPAAAWGVSAAAFVSQRISPASRDRCAWKKRKAT